MVIQGGGAVSYERGTPVRSACRSVVFGVVSLGVVSGVSFCCVVPFFGVSFGGVVSFFGIVSLWGVISFWGVTSFCGAVSFLALFRSVALFRSSLNATSPFVQLIPLHP